MVSVFPVKIQPYVSLVTINPTGKPSICLPSRSEPLNKQGTLDCYFPDTWTLKKTYNDTETTVYSKRKIIAHLYTAFRPDNILYIHIHINMGFPGGSAVKNPPAKQELQELRFQSLGREDPPEEGMATHSSILAWRISWTEESGGLQSTGSRRIGRDWSDLSTQICIRTYTYT